MQVIMRVKPAGAKKHPKWRRRLMPKKCHFLRLNFRFKWISLLLILLHTHTHTFSRKARAPMETGPHGQNRGRTENTDGHESRTQVRTLLSCSDSPASDFRRLAICLAHSFLEAKQSQARNKAKTLISALNGTTATSYMANNAHFNVYWWATCVLQHTHTPPPHSLTTPLFARISSIHETISLSLTKVWCRLYLRIAVLRAETLKNRSWYLVVSIFETKIKFYEFYEIKIIYNIIYKYIL